MGQEGSSQKSRHAGGLVVKKYPGRFSLEEYEIPTAYSDARPEVPKAKRRIERFRMHVSLHSASDMCDTMLRSWMKEKTRVYETWSELSYPAKRTLVTIAREKIMIRARFLYRLITAGYSNGHDNDKPVRKLVEKCASEIFDIGIVYSPSELPNLIETVFRTHGGGRNPPPILLAEVSHAFHPMLRAQSWHSLTPKGNGTIDDEKTLSNVLIPDIDRSQDEAKMDLERPIEPGPLLPRDMLVNCNRKEDGSQFMSGLISFISGLQLNAQNRRKLTLELLMEMRDAVLIHFSILLFSELFEDTKKVLYRYEYNSDSDTAVSSADTEIEEEDFHTSL